MRGYHIIGFVNNPQAKKSHKYRVMLKRREARTIQNAQNRKAVKK